MDTGELRLPLFPQTAGSADGALLGTPMEYADGVPVGHRTLHGDHIGQAFAPNGVSAAYHGDRRADPYAVLQPPDTPAGPDHASGAAPGQRADGRPLFRDGTPWYGI
ncbi:hypothetical protein [Streptomyces sp. NPDC047009]